MSLPYVRVEIGFTGPYLGTVFTIGDPTNGRVGSVPIGSGNSWVDVSRYVRSWQVRRGTGQANSPTRRYDPGTATVVFNDGDRRFDPDNLAGPYVSGGASMIQPMRRVRITAVWNGTAYVLFTGYADDWVPDYQHNVWTYTTLTATDAHKVWAAADRTAVSGVGGGELTGARISRVLDSFDWPATDRAIDSGNTTVQATTLTGGALTELQLVQDTEQGELFADENGWAVFLDRASSFTRAESLDSQVTFGDGGYAATGEIPYADVKLTSLSDNLANRVTIGRVGGTPQTVEDVDSIGSYLVRGYERTDLLMESDGEALTRAQALLRLYKDAVRQVARVEFNRPRIGIESVFWPAVLGRTFGDRVTVVRRPAGGGDPIERDVLVRGIEHASDGTSWSAAFVLQSASPFSYFTIGHADRGRIGAYPIAF